MECMKNFPIFLSLVRIIQEDSNLFENIFARILAEVINMVLSMMKIYLLMELI